MAIRIDAEGIRRLFPEIDQIRDAKLRQGVIDIWREIAAECPWERFEDIPKNTGDERHRPLVGHVRGVTRMALAMAEIAAAEHGTPYDRDLLLAACLLHDASKPVESEPDPEGPPTGGSVLPGRTSVLGKSVQHSVYAAHKIMEKGLPLELTHLVITHTHQSNVRAAGFEAALIFYADFADSDAGIASTGRETFARRWRLR